jgi:hypothetical protein
MVNSEELFGTTEYLTIQLTYRKNDIIITGFECTCLGTDAL